MFDDVLKFEILDEPLAKHLLGQHDQKTHGGGHSTARPYELERQALHVGYKHTSLKPLSERTMLERYTLPISYGSYDADWQSATGVQAQANVAMQIATIANVGDDGRLINNDAIIAEIANDPDYPRMSKSLEEKLENLRFNDRTGSDPEVEAYLKKENQFVLDKLRERKLDDGTTIGQVMDDMAESSLAELRNIAISNDLTLTMPLTRFKQMVADGRYKTVYEAKRSGKGGSREDYIQARYDVESKLGVPTNTPDAERPVYGIFGTDGMTYGDVRVVMKDALKHRTTVTIGDSIDGKADRAFWASDLAEGKVDNEAFWDSVSRRVSMFAFNDYVSKWFDYDLSKSSARIKGYKGLKIKDLAEYGYIESQIHGGVKLGDIASIVLPPSYKIPKAMQAIFDANGIAIDRAEIERTNVG